MSHLSASRLIKEVKFQSATSADVLNPFSHIYFKIQVTDTGYGYEYFPPEFNYTNLVDNTTKQEVGIYQKKKFLSEIIIRKRNFIFREN